MATRAAFEGLLERLHASGTRADGVPQFLRELKQPFNAHVIGLHFHDIDHRLHDFNSADGLDDLELATLAARIADGRHIWFERGAESLVTDGVADGRQLSTETELLHSSFYQDFLSPMDVRHGMAIALHAADGVPLAAVTINRDSRRGHFLAAEVALAKRILPHLRNIYALQQRLS